MVRSRNTGDPTYRFQIAGLLVFLAGVDKALSLAMELLYLSGRIDWKWLRGGQSGRAGLISCWPGMTPKLVKLKQLGLDLSDLQWLVDIRNNYVHSCSLDAGYKLGFDARGRVRVRPHRLELSFSGEPLTALGPDDLRAYSRQLKKRLGGFLDRNGWEQAWKSIDTKLARLPRDPAPEYPRIARREAGVEETAQGIAALNARYVGEGLRKLLTPSS